MSESLDRIKKWCDLALDNNCSTTMYKYELVDILNYITNLEQENKQLEEDKKKAREYIKDNDLYEGSFKNYITPLLAILGGKE